MSDYHDFLHNKQVAVEAAGFDPGELPAGLFPWQAEIVRRACRMGRAAIFAGCGLGKTAMQLAWADQVCRHTGGPVLVLTPLAVGPQTVAEAAKFGIRGVRLCRNQDEVVELAEDWPPIAVANYQKLLKGRFDPAAFAGVVLDESSILKNYVGKTKRLLLESFKATRYRLCCTATPAPNDYMELGNHAAFLGVMDADEMLGRWFISDQGAGAGHYRLKGHAAADYWRWVAGWAVCLDRPSDLGYPDDGFELPPLHIVQHVVDVDERQGAGTDRDGNAVLWRDGLLTATSLHQEMRLTAAARAAAVAELVEAEGGTWAVWCNTNYEADELMARIPGAVEVRGNERDDVKERKLVDFSEGRTPVLVTKPTIAGFGMNWQHCHNTAVVGLSYSYEQFHQLIARFWRFGQKQPVNVHIFVAETEGGVLAAIQRKQQEYQAMRESMKRATAGVGLYAGSGRLELRPTERDVAKGDSWTIHLGDCVEVLRELPERSIDFTVFSPPFAGLYIYSDAQADMGNCVDDAEFFRHFGYAVPELLRVTVPGRLCAVHCKDLPLYANRDEVSGLRDFPGDLVRLFTGHGWTFHSRVTIWKCPVTERERTNNVGLLHASVVRDSSCTRQGMADFLLVFRRPPEGEGLRSDKPIERPDGLDRYVGDPAVDPRTTDWHPSPYARKNKASSKGDHRFGESINIWRRKAEPVWWDIDQTDTLNEKIAREAGDEKHICPLQLGLIRRAVYLWSLPGDTVLSPFAGIGSEGVVSVQEGRRFVGVELKRAYWERACRSLAAAEREAKAVLPFADNKEAA